MLRRRAWQSEQSKTKKRHPKQHFNIELGRGGEKAQKKKNLG